MSVNLLKPEKIDIIDFKIIKGAIENPFEFNSKKVKGHKFDLDLDLNFNLADRLAKADFKVEVESTSNGENDAEAKGAFHFVFIFHIENIDELVEEKEDKSLNVNGGLGNALASIAYSTSRGILMTRFQGTSLNDFILPVINPNDLLKN